MSSSVTTSSSGGHDSWRAGGGKKNAPQNLLGDRMKELESAYESIVDTSGPYVIRVDGNRFSKFTCFFNKPFDERISDAMIHTSADLLKRFNAAAAYTFSDEISIVFRALRDEETGDPLPPSMAMYNARVQKLTSVATGYATARFNYHMTRQVYDQSDESDKKAMAVAHGGLAHFDGRIFAVPTEEECLQNILWRGVDCLRNSKTGFGRKYFRSSVLEGMSSKDVVEKCRIERHAHWEELPSHFTHGTLLKKSQVLKRAYNPKLEQEVEVKRSCVVATSLASIDGVSDGAIELLFSKYASDCPAYEDQFTKLEPSADLEFASKDT